MIFRARRALNRVRFDAGVRSLRRTSALHVTDHSFMLVSMVCHGETLMYLLAAKSFCKQLGRVPDITVLDDGSLTEGDRALLRQHIPDIRIVSVHDVGTGACPKGNCWERLLLITDLLADRYVVQLDCDTLSMRPMPEIAACIADNRSFTLLGDRSHPSVEPMLEACARLKHSDSTQVQAVCERAFDQLREASSLKYLRGNAGFTGFAKGSLTRERVGWFSDRMRSLAPAKWDDWGSEQLTSNLLIANSQDPVPLPSPQYISYWADPQIRYENSTFIHFIGPHRYSHGLYRKSAQQVLAQIK